MKFLSLAFLALALFNLSAAKVSLEFPNRVVAVGDVHADFNKLVSILLKTKLIEEVKLPMLRELASTVKGALAVVEFRRCLSVPSTGHTGFHQPGMTPSRQHGATTSRSRSVPSNSRFGDCLHKNDWQSKQEQRAKRYRWIGKDTVLIQLGDMVDRGTDTIAVYALLARLREQAAKAGGAVIPLIGDHDMMNACGQKVRELNSLTMTKELATFGSQRATYMTQLQNRESAFGKDGFIGKEIREWDAVVLVGGILYSHGGLSEKYAEKSIPSINKEIRDAMKTNDCSHPSVLKDTEGPLWYRGYKIDHSTKPEDLEKICESLGNSLSAVNANRMVIGHNVQKDGKIREACVSKLFLIDVGMSAGAYNNPAAALEFRYTYTEEDGEKKISTTKISKFEGEK